MRRTERPELEKTGGLRVGVVGIALQGRDRGGGASPLEELRSSRVRFARTSKLFEFLKLRSFAPPVLTLRFSHLRCSNSCRDGSRTHEPSRFGTSHSHLRCSNSAPRNLMASQTPVLRTVVLRSIALPVSPSSHLTVLELPSRTFGAHTTVLANCRVLRTVVPQMAIPPRSTAL
ncbi:hypothetical protein DSECCO2_48050 [anaerobic digester metagenome]